MWVKSTVRLSAVLQWSLTNPSNRRYVSKSQELTIWAIRWISLDYELFINIKYYITPHYITLYYTILYYSLLLYREALVFGKGTWFPHRFIHGCLWSLITLISLKRCIILTGIWINWIIWVHRGLNAIERMKLSYYSPRLTILWDSECA